MTDTVGSWLQPRDDAELPGRFARSAAEEPVGLDGFDRWFDERREAQRFRVDRVPFRDLDMWSFAPNTGDLAHSSGRFFVVSGLQVTNGDSGSPSWQQPIVVQPEVGILGILAKEFDGVMHFLMQAKMEPGNSELLQLSPTVQATRSNYMKVHKGRSVPYLDYFTGRRPVRVLADVLQSEQGSWFFRKSNRNMIVETDEDVEPGADFRWFTLGQLGALLRRDSVVNMDSRSVLACVPVAPEESGALKTDIELLSWFTAERSRHEVHVQRIPLGSVQNWRRGDWSIDHRMQQHFRVIAVSVRADNREVQRWTQPLIEPVGPGIAAFVYRRFHGIPHVLVHARVEGGFLDTVELGPTAQRTIGRHAHHATGGNTPLLNFVLDAQPERVRYSAVLSEEGGRFFEADVRYVFVEGDERTTPADPPPGYHWVTQGQLNMLVRHGRYLNVQARTLLAVLNTGAVRL